MMSGHSARGDKSPKLGGVKVSLTGKRLPLPEETRAGLERWRRRECTPGLARGHPHNTGNPVPLGSLGGLSMEALSQNHILRPHIK